MKVFERITFPTAAVYNVNANITAKMEGIAEVKLIKKEVTSEEPVCKYYQNKIGRVIRRVLKNFKTAIIRSNS